MPDGAPMYWWPPVSARRPRDDLGPSFRPSIGDSRIPSRRDIGKAAFVRLNPFAPSTVVWSDLCLSVDVQTEHLDAEQSSVHRVVRRQGKFLLDGDADGRYATDVEID
jgi:hypothetical protein